MNDLEQRIAALEQQLSGGMQRISGKTDVMPGSLQPRLLVPGTQQNGDLYYSNGTNFVRLGLGTKGSLLYANTVPSWLVPGAANQVLTTLNSVPTWQAPQTSSFNNPYKFLVYRNAAQNTGNGAEAVIGHDTKVYDTGGNVDVVTNKGRFTAPIAGFYFFSARYSIPAQTASRIIITLRKNGAAYHTGNDINPVNSVTGVVVSGILQLVANDYIEIGAFGAAAYTMEVGDTNKAYFAGFLVSAT